MGSDSVPDSGGLVPDLGDAVPYSGGAVPNLGIYFCLVPDLGFVSSCGARFGIFFIVWCQIWAFGKMAPGKRRLEDRNKGKTMVSTIRKS